MKQVCVCGCCGRTIEKEFMYCPWCGKEKETKQKNSFFLEPVFEKLEDIQNKNRLLRINKIENTLNELEKDLSYMILQAEMAQ
ncbi:MAG: hypothetical protein GX220_01575 [Treponema sp.]|nr:hypothetical protein [Treponema sp.]